MENKLALELKGVTKKFGKVVANHDVSLQVHHGEILAILGENGSGKTTLMNMVSGIYFPDEGQIFVDGEEVVIKSPKDAFKYKIGMIHQHFKLVDVFTATENIVLGVEDGKKYNIKEAKSVLRLSRTSMALILIWTKKSTICLYPKSRLLKLSRYFTEVRIFSFLTSRPLFLPHRKQKNYLMFFAICVRTVNQLS